MHLRGFLADLDKIGPLGKVTGWMDGGGWVVKNRNRIERITIESIGYLLAIL